MIRTVLTPQQQHVSIHVPENYVGKQVEVIVFTIEETIKDSLTKDNPLIYFASEQVLSKYWLTPEEDKAWKDL